MTDRSGWRTADTAPASGMISVSAWPLSKRRSANAAAAPDLRWTAGCSAPPYMCRTIPPCKPRAETKPIRASGKMPEARIGFPRFIISAKRFPMATKTPPFFTAGTDHAPWKRTKGGGHIRGVRHWAFGGRTLRASSNVRFGRCGCLGIRRTEPFLNVQFPVQRNIHEKLRQEYDVPQPQHRNQKQRPRRQQHIEPTIGQLQQDDPQHPLGVFHGKQGCICHPV